MSTRDPNSPPASSEQDDSLSATGMFLRAFEKQGTEQSQPTESPRTGSQSGAGASSMTAAPPAAAANPAKPSGSSGEFTQFFQTLDKKPAQAATAPTPASNIPKSSGPAEAPAGEFTKVFSGASSASAGGSPQTSAAAPSSRSKGFSTPGVSESASAGGSFTQFFKAAPPPPKDPAPPAPSPIKSEDVWKPEPMKQEAQTTSTAPAGSVTSILSSLASPSTGTGAPKQADPVAYRPEPTPVISAPAMPQHSAADSEPGGVTRLIRKLSQEQAAPAPPLAPAPAPAAAPVTATPGEPGEFTRMISKIGGTPSAPPSFSDPAPATPPAASGGPLIAVNVQGPQIPPVPHVAPVAPVAAPTPKVSAQVSVAQPHMPHIPATPKIDLPHPPALAVAPPKSKLEAMVPMLLIINTFLLLIVLVVLIFLIKGR